MILAGCAAAPLTGGLDLPIAARAPVEDGFTEVRDEPWARALVLDDSYHQVALVAVDLFLLDPTVVTAARHRVEAAVGIPAAQVYIVPTGVLTAPLAATLPGMPRPSKAYGEYVARQVASAVVYAARARQPAAVGWARGDAVVGRCPFGHLRGPLVMRVDSLDGLPLGVLVELPTLPCQVGRVLSADYPGELARVLERLRPGLGVVGLLGPAAGVEPPLDDYVELGERLGGLAWAAALEAEPSPDAELQIASTRVSLPLAPPDPEAAAARLKRAAERLEGVADPLYRRAAEGERQRAELAHRISTGEGPPARDIDVTAVKVGDGAMVLTPVQLSGAAGELAVLRSSYGDKTLAVSGAGDTLGLLTTVRQRLDALASWSAPVPFDDPAAELWAAAVARLLGGDAG